MPRYSFLALLEVDDMEEPQLRQTFLWGVVLGLSPCLPLPQWVSVLFWGAPSRLAAGPREKALPLWAGSCNLTPDHCQIQWRSEGQRLRNLACKANRNVSVCRQKCWLYTEPQELPNHKNCLSLLPSSSSFPPPPTFSLSCRCWPEILLAWSPCCLRQPTHVCLNSSAAFRLC